MNTYINKLTISFTDRKSLLRCIDEIGSKTILTYLENTLQNNTYNNEYDSCIVDPITIVSTDHVSNEILFEIETIGIPVPLTNIFSQQSIHRFNLNKIILLYNSFTLQNCGVTYYENNHLIQWRSTYSLEDHPEVIEDRFSAELDDADVPRNIDVFNSFKFFEYFNYNKTNELEDLQQMDEYGWWKSLKIKIWKKLLTFISWR